MNCEQQSIERQARRKVPGYIVVGGKPPKYAGCQCDENGYSPNKPESHRERATRRCTKVEIFHLALAQGTRHPRTARIRRRHQEKGNGDHDSEIHIEIRNEAQEETERERTPLETPNQRICLQCKSRRKKMSAPHVTEAADEDEERKSVVYWHFSSLA